MRIKRKNAAFTLIELLTVIAIIGILATLMLTAVSSAKKLSHRARCMSNLHQVSLALNMYIDDYEKRSPELGRLSSVRYLEDRQVLLCPMDKTGGWGNLVNPSPFLTSYSTGNYLFTADRSGNATTNEAALIPYSYLNPLPWEDWAWERLTQLGSLAGVAVCQMHGLGKPNLTTPSYRDFQGVILRAQRDGAVVKREVYWELASVPLIPPPSSAVTTPINEGDSAVTGYSNEDSKSNLGNSYSYPWKLYSDNPNP